MVSLLLCAKPFHSPQVSYTGLVEWTSPAGVYTTFQEQGWKMTGDTSTTFSPLTPSTEYVFSVGIVTDDGQYGPLTTATVTTGMQSGGLYVAIQMI